MKIDQKTQIWIHLGPFGDLGLGRWLNINRNLFSASSPKVLDKLFEAAWRQCLCCCAGRQGRFAWTCFMPGTCWRIFGWLKPISGDDPHKTYGSDF